MSVIHGSEDDIAQAMLNGLSEAFKVELRAELMAVAEKEVDAVVERVSKRVELQLSEYWDNMTFTHRIRLLWSIKRDAA